MNSNQNAIIVGVKKTLAKYNYFHKIAIEIDGKLFYYTSAQIRALLVYMQELRNSNYAEFNTLRELVVVYAGPRKRTAEYRITITEEGKFSDKFPDGFLDVEPKLHMLTLTRR